MTNDVLLMRVCCAIQFRCGWALSPFILYIYWALLLLLLLSVIIIMIIFFQKSQEREQPPNFNDLPSPSRSPPRPSVTSYLLYYSPIGDITGIHLSDILWNAVCAAVGPSCLLYARASLSWTCTSPRPNFLSLSIYRGDGQQDILIVSALPPSFASADLLGTDLFPNSARWKKKTSEDRIYGALQEEKRSYDRTYFHVLRSLWCV